ncbi:MAG: SpoIIE family protein phosphatase [Leptospirales bacterium]|jgi:serine phosphatase RsbU (regulator of sigma subunit)
MSQMESTGHRSAAAGDGPARSTPNDAQPIGGDLYDALPLSENRFAFMIADVSGPGVPAAFLTTKARAIFARAVAAHPDHPEAVWRSVNRDMYSFIGLEPDFAFERGEIQLEPR